MRRQAGRTKITLPMAMLVALTGLAHAQSSTDDTDKKSPWSGAVIDHKDGGLGSRTSILKKDVGDGWSIGGQLTTKYQDPNIGGTGAPPPHPFRGESRSNTVIGPYFEKKF